MGAWQDAVTPETKLVFFESVANPTLEVTDIKAVAEIAHNVGALVVVDNVFATQTFSSPLELGADVVVYSTTKHVDGQGRCLGGIILGTKEFIRGTLEPYLKHTGGALSPFNAWVMLKGLETMDLRVQAQAASALALAQALEGHDKLGRVLFPGLKSHPDADLVARQMDGQGGTVLSLDIKGGQAAAFSVPERAGNRADLEQSGRYQIDHHPPRDHHASTPNRRSTRHVGHHCRAGAPVYRGLRMCAICRRMCWAHWTRFKAGLGKIDRRRYIEPATGNRKGRT